MGRLLARARGVAVPARGWLGITIAVVGAAALTGGDFALSPRALLGDLLGLAGGVFGAAYVSVGARRGRHHLPQIRRTALAATSAPGRVDSR